MSQNQTTRYFKYAIGEIILVVIGILLALSINQWNENRINLKKTNDYIEKVISDIALDTTQIDFFLGNEKERQLDFDNYFNLLDNGNVSIAQMKDSINAFRITTGFVEFTTTTYEQLVASANFELISENKRLAIVNYYKFCSVIKDRVISYENTLRLESFEARKYIDSDNKARSFFDAINYPQNEELIVRGLKHMHNRILLDHYKSEFIITVGEAYMQNARQTLETLKSDD